MLASPVVPFALFFLGSGFPYKVATPKKGALYFDMVTGLLRMARCSRKPLSASPWWQTSTRAWGILGLPGRSPYISPSRSFSARLGPGSYPPKKEPTSSLSMILIYSLILLPLPHSILVAIPKTTPVKPELLSLKLPPKAQTLNPKP